MPRPYLVCSNPSVVEGPHVPLQDAAPPHGHAGTESEARSDLPRLLNASSSYVSAVPFGASSE